MIRFSICLLPLLIGSCGFQPRSSQPNSDAADTPKFEDVLTADHRLVSYTCTYWSKTEVEFRFRFLESWADDIKSARIIFGWAGNSFENGEPIEWDNLSSHDFQIDENATWNLSVKRDVSVRSEPGLYKALQFVVKVAKQDGSSFYLKGSSSRLGFYQMDFALSRSQCVEEGREIPFAPITPKAIVRP